MVDGPRELHDPRNAYRLTPCPPVPMLNGSSIGAGYREPRHPILVPSIQ